MDQYDRMGDKYVWDNESGLIHEFYERPAIQSLLGSVDGLTVLDIGCGPGVMAEWLIEHGAMVVAGDKSGSMLASARRRLGTRGQVLHLDLSAPLPLDADSFDVVVASLVLHYLPTWESPLMELGRVLKPGGRLIVSTHHPFADYRWFDRPDYFANEELQDVWKKGGEDFEVEFWRRPLTDMVRAFKGAGFSIDNLLESQPLEIAANRDPDWYRQMTTEPTFLFFALSFQF